MYILRTNSLLGMCTSNLKSKTFDLCCALDEIFIFARLVFFSLQTSLGLSILLEL